jgi:predicted ATPase/signal transduction histidine kinase/tRNA A-37 threonylcarbamoyl transferase component Bud32
MITIPGYHINKQIYESLNSRVYRGCREEDNFPVVLKVLREDYPLPEELARYKREYNLICSLNLKGVIKAYGLQKYQHTLVMFLEDFGGDSLDLLLPDRKVTLEEFLILAIQITEILGEIHHQQVIHKDINPSNIVWNPDTGQLKIIDFGLSTILSREKPAIKSPEVLEGTLAYISPEQTGRMNRSIDYRTDFYSLGVTFYELLTGKLPFESHDSMELVHAHIAKIPVPPDEVNEAVSPVISNIVMKLMAKTVEERYQIAEGLKMDLEKCYTQLKETGQVEAFPLGQNDISGQFQIPEKLYGRDEETKHLLSIFDHVAAGHTGIALCLGEPGIGKSALINEIHKPIVEKRGYFIAGKYDQFKRNIPYTAIAHAFQELARQILTESGARLGQWKEKILQGVGNNGQVIIDIIPELELVIGPQPDVQPLPAAEAQNRFQYIFQNFVRAISQAEHPLVLFLDDLQWADSASLNLLKALTTDEENQYFLLIGAYRDNEVEASHPLLLTLEEIKQARTVVNAIKLELLSFDHMNELIADTLHYDPAYVWPLTELVYEKTQGNAFFVTQFLKSLYEEGLLIFDFERQGWQWETEQIRARDVTDNVIELMTGKIWKLSPETQAVLQLAACIGNRFDLETLAVIYEHKAAETFAQLWPSIEESLVLPLDDNYKLISAAEEEQVEVQSAFKFLHDRVQQAAYALTPETERQAIHFNIGRLLLSTTPTEVLGERAFDIVNHLNYGVAFISDEIEKVKLAELNLMAGRKAKSSTAYDTALRYLIAGIELLAQNSWIVAYPLTFALYIERAECEYLCGHFEQGEKLFDTLLSQAKSKQDRVKVYSIQIVQYTNMGKYLEAIEVGLEALKLFGVTVPETELQEAIGVALQEVELNLGGRSVEELINLPKMTNSDKQTVLNLLVNMASPVYIAKPEWSFIVVLKMVSISLKYGNAKASAYAYDTYGAILGPTLGDYQKGYEFGLLALQLNEKFNDLKLKCQVYASFAININHWRKPLESSFPLLREAYQSGLEAGDLLWAGYVCCSLILSSFSRGNELNSVYEEFEKYIRFIEKIQNPMLPMVKITAQSILNLKGLTQSKWNLNSEGFDETQVLETLRQNAYDHALHWYYLCKIKIFVLYENPTEALEMVVGSEKALGGALGQFSVAEHYFYHSLTLTALYPKATEDEQEQYWQKLEANQAQMKIWAENCPENFQHKYLLVAAKMAGFKGKDFEAMQLYKQAVQSARENGFIQNEALANELAARFYLEKGFEEFAISHLKEAHYDYQLWGATRKVEELEEQYPWLTQTTIERDLIRTTPSPRDSDTTTGSKLDLISVVKASQAISSEIDLDKLLAQLIRIVIENAGAQRGCLVLAHQERLSIEAEWADDQAEAQVLQSKPIETDSPDLASLPVEIIQYVIRTRENVVLDDAGLEGDFTHAPYVVKHQSRSILCAPLISQGKLLALIYLENKLTPSAFTPERLEVLNLLSSQMAISLENALLYDDLKRHRDHLEELVNERTQELSQTLEDLKATQTQLIESEKMAALGQLVAGVAHEINTPVGIGITMASGLEEKTKSLVAAYQEGQLERSALEKYWHTAIQGSQLILSNLQQVAKLVQSFKQVAVDQISLEKYRFPVKAYLEATLLSLDPQLRQAKHTLTITGDEAITIDSYPGALSQVATNLVMNSITHAYPQGEQGHLRFDLTQDQDRIIIEYTDDGCGIPPQNLDKIFEPFFTTARSRGGSGLGLHIVYNVVTQKLKGTIHCESESGSGTKFILTVPL